MFPLLKRSMGLPRFPVGSVGVGCLPPSSSDGAKKYHRSRGAPALEAEPRAMGESKIVSAKSKSSVNARSGEPVRKGLNPGLRPPAGLYSWIPAKTKSGQKKGVTLSSRSSHKLPPPSSRGAGTPANASAEGPCQLSKSQVQAMKRSLPGATGRRCRQHLARWWRRSSKRKGRQAIDRAAHSARVADAVAASTPTGRRVPYGSRVKEGHGSVVFFRVRYSIGSSGSVFSYQGDFNVGFRQGQIPYDNEFNPYRSAFTSLRPSFHSVCLLGGKERTSWNACATPRKLDGGGRAMREGKRKSPKTNFQVEHANQDNSCDGPTNVNSVCNGKFALGAAEGKSFITLERPDKEGCPSLGGNCKAESKSKGKPKAKLKKTWYFALAH